MTVRPKKILLTLAVVLLIFLVILLILPQSLSALGLSVPFGGMVLFATPCTCSTGTLLTVGPPKGGEYMLTPASVVYAKYNPTPGHWVLGLADVFLPCLVGEPPVCIPAGGGPAIRMMGTN